MPQAIGAAVAWAVAEAFAISVTTFALIELGVTLLVASAFVYAANELFAPELPDIDNYMRDLKRNIRAPLVSRRYVYGNPVVGGAVAFMDSTSYAGKTSKDILHIVTVHAAHQVAGFGKLYFNDTEIVHNMWHPDEDGVPYSYARQDWITFWSTGATYGVEIDGVKYSSSSVAGLATVLNALSKFTAVVNPARSIEIIITGVSVYPLNDWELRSPYVIDSNGGYTYHAFYSKYHFPYFTIFLHNGNEYQLTNPDLAAATPKWTSAHRLRGLAYSYIQLHWNQDLWVSGIPSFKVQVYGKELIINATTQEKMWSDNWARCIADYMQSDPRLKLTDADFNQTYLTDAINTSDEAITNDSKGRYIECVGGRFSGWNTNSWDLYDGVSEWDRVINAYDTKLHTQGITSLTKPTVYKYNVITDFYNQSISVDGKLFNIYADLAGVPTLTWQWTSAINGADYPLIRIRGKYLTSRGGAWYGRVYYKTVARPTYDPTQYGTFLIGFGTTSYSTIEVDMTTVTGPDTDEWITNFITGIQVIFVNSSTLAGDFSIDWMSITNYDKRYTLNGVADLGAKPVSNLSKMLTAGVGALTYVQGIYRLHVGKYQTPTITLTESDLRDTIQVSANTPKDKLFNVVKALYVEPETFYSSVSIPEITHSTYQAEDGERLVVEVQLPYTYDAYTARRIALIYLERNRQQIKVNFPAKLTLLQVATMNVINLTLSKFGWVDKPFRVVEWTLTELGGCNLTLVEEAATSYNDVLDYIDSEPDTELSSPWYVNAPVNFAADSSMAQVDILADGTILTRVLLTWASEDLNAYEYQVEYKKSADATYAHSQWVKDEQVFITGVIDKVLYDFRVRSKNYLGTAYSEWVYILNHYVIGKSEPPQDVTGMGYAIVDNGLLLSWTPVTDLDFDKYCVREGGTLWEDAQELGVTKTAMWKVTPVTSGSHIYRVKALDTTGNCSLNEANLTVVIQPPDTPVVQYAYLLSSVIISWQDCTTDFAIERYDVFKDSVFLTRTTTTSFVIDVSWASSTFTVQAYDIHGNVSGAIGSTTITPVPPEITNIRSTVVDNNVLLYWEIIQNDLPAKEIELRRGDVYATATVIGVKSGTFTSIFEPLGGNFTYWLAPFDSAGNYGTEQSLTVAVNEPPDYVLNVEWPSTFSGKTENALASEQVLIGNCFETYEIADWTVPAGNTLSASTDAYAGVHSGLFQSTLTAPSSSATTEGAYLILPIEYAQRYQGNTVRIRFRAKKPATSPATQFALAYSTNEAGGSGWVNFTPTDAWVWYEFEYTIASHTPTSADYVGVWGDTSGSNLGVLIDMLQVDIKGVDSSRLILPVNTTINYEDHFTSNSWATPDAQITAGFPIYIMPSCDLGIYEETFDYLTVLSGTRVTVELTSTIISGAPVLTVKVATSTDLVTWKEYIDVLQLLSSNFRYVRLTLEVASTGGDDILQIDDVKVKLDSKLHNDSGSGITSPAGGFAHNNTLAHLLPFVVGSTSPTGWTLRVSTNHDLIIAGTDTPAIQESLTGAPNEPVWQITPQTGDTTYNGGAYVTDALPDDMDYMYIGAMFVKLVTNGNISCGIYSRTAAGTVDSYRMSDGALTTNNTGYTTAGSWVLLVSILHPRGTPYNPGTETGVAGIYQLSTGTKLADGPEAVIGASSTNLGFVFEHVSATTFGTPGSLCTRPLVRRTTSLSAANDVQELIYGAINNGALVEFGATYVDIDSIVANNFDLNNYNPVINFIDIPQPRSFNLFLLNSSGVPQVGAFSWISRGY